MNKGRTIITTRLRRELEQIRTAIGEQADKLVAASGMPPGPRLSGFVNGRCLGFPPEVWPAGLVAPLTARAALEHVEENVDRLAADVEGELRRAVRLLVEPARRSVLFRAEGERLCEAWPWPTGLGPALAGSGAHATAAAWFAFACLRRAVDMRTFRERSQGDWPADVTAVEVAAWLAPLLDRPPSSNGLGARVLRCVTAGYGMPDLQVAYNGSPLRLPAVGVAGVYLAWRRMTGTRPASFRVPTAMIAGDGAIARLFGRSHRGRLNGLLGTSGRIVRVEVSSGTAQLDLYHDELLRLEQPTPEALLAGVGRVLTNRTLRMFMCCIAAAFEDEAVGRVKDGAGLFFYFTPSRFADLHGLRRHHRQGGERHHDRHSRVMDVELAKLAKVSVTATVKRGGREFLAKADRIVFFAHGRLDPLPKRRGRRPALLYCIHPFVREMMLGGGSFFHLSTAALAAPDGVDQRTWDDAFKLLVVLTSHARGNPEVARDSGGLWTRAIEGLSADANVTPDAAPSWRKRQRTLDLLAVLERAGHVTWQLAGGDGGTDRVLFDIPAYRPALATIKPRQVRDRREAG